MNINKLLAAVILSTTIVTSAFAGDHYQQIRNATGQVEIAGKTFLIDPMLAKKDAYPGFENTHNSQLRFPLVELPVTIENTYKGVEGIIVTHTHLDHWDPAAAKLLPKDILIITQHEEDAQLIRNQGFKNVKVLNGSMEFGDVTLVKTHGAHGTDEMFASPLSEILGEAMGVVFKAKDHKTVYLAGDTLWNAEVNKAIVKYKPDVLVLNTGDARNLTFPDSGIIMGTKDVRHAYEMLPEAKIITVHMDAVNHTTVSRADMRAYIKENKLDDRVVVPNDGETVKY
ncbi:MBL fold metallo-hydrolase (plasmid) [Lelliottia amnigena]|uniref:MBL fold metallo-hydrolase n=2 Tax=Enterobacteriaceae TaxID=543 RepID=UPI001F2C2D07|nr:MBL fold metallo-hydrolase [Lelliottia amnigena]UJD97006.1 MBL fold metallo-hydrolase [Lelliottia amnigena]